MRNNSDETDWRDLAIYAELAPIARHRSFVDHLFVLKDCGRLNGFGGNLFASPFSEIALMGRHQTNRSADDHDAIMWKTVHLAPRFGRQSRRNNFHGWIIGLRCQPLEPERARAALTRLSEINTPPDHDNGSLDPIIRALDRWIDHLRPELESTTAPGPHAQDHALAGSRRSRANSVTAMADAAGIAPRTLQRRLRSQTGLAPKRFLSVQRVSDALRPVALGRDSFADVAFEAGYSDQAHLTAELGRHTGLSPGRLRTLALAHQPSSQDAVRFFKDSALRDRARLLLSDSGAADDEVTDDELPAQRSQLRGPRPGRLRAPGRDENPEYRDRQHRGG